MENRKRDDNKIFWSNGYQNWFNEEFEKRLRIIRKSFVFYSASYKTIHIKTCNQDCAYFYRNSQTTCTDNL